MSREPRAPESVRKLVPMVESIAKEIDERTTLLDELEARIDVAMDAYISGPTDKLSALFAEAAVQRRAVRCALLELERLGCSIVRRHPLTLRIADTIGKRTRSCIWQHGASPLRWA